MSFPNLFLISYLGRIFQCEGVKQKQAEVTRILDINKTKYELIDVSISEHLLQEMRAKAGNPNAVPPQIFNGDDYCGLTRSSAGVASHVIFQQTKSLKP
uniref:Uncharacterized protein n=1 Tax=Terrapene triunguis TaxID=2587831 RepID=A0A674I5N2_9SAUR